VDAGLVSESKLSEALAEQNRTNKLVGEILVATGAVDRRDLDIALSLQEELADAGKAVRLAAGIRNMLGELLVLAGRITTEQLEGVLAQQKRTGEMIGQLLVRCGFTTQAEIDAVIEIQKAQTAGIDLPTPLRLGELLVAAGHISRQQLTAALGRQKETGQKLGEVLVESGAVDAAVIGWGVRLQWMLLRAVLIAALSLAAAHVPVAEAGIALSRQVSLNAIVLARAQLNVLKQPRNLVITDADVRRGFVQIDGATLVEIKTNSPAGCLLSFAVHELPFRETSVNIMGREIVLGPDGGLVTLPVTDKSTVTLNYRFVLAPETMAGTYAWPFALAVSPL
jgi:hypothetical protein